MGLTSEQALAQTADDNERIIATLMAARMKSAWPPTRAWTLTT